MRLLPSWRAALGSACLTTIVAAVATAHPAPPVSRAPAVALIGVVKDTAGVLLPNVQVIIASLNRVATTDAAGSFTFRGLAAGHYHLDAILLGYARADAEVDLPTTGADVRITIIMRQTAMRTSAPVAGRSTSASARA